MSGVRCLYNKAFSHLEYSSTHRELVEACKNGHREAQFELYRLYSKAMYNTCLRMLRNEADAEDILQNSFIDVFRNLERFRYESSIGAWMKRIVINNCINFLKKRRIHFDELDDSVTEPRQDVSEPSGYGKLEIGAVKEAIGGLPDGYRAVFTLYAMEGYDHKEIAQILDITEATSKSQYSRAKKKLRDHLLDQAITY